MAGRLWSWLKGYLGVFTVDVSDSARDLIGGRAALWDIDLSKEFSLPWSSVTTV